MPKFIAPEGGRKSIGLAVKMDEERRASLARLVSGPLLPPAYLSSMAKIGETTRRVVAGFAGAQAPWNRSIAEILRPLQDVFVRIEAEGQKARLVSSCGWLPHETMPFNEIDIAQASPEEVDALVEAHYRHNWASIENTIAHSVDGYDIDDEAKATYREALTAHGLGLFRVSPRLLFPEIERVVSVELYGGEHEAVPATGGRKRPITSMKELREEIQQMPAGDVLAYAFATELMERLDAHLYEHVGDDPGNLARFASDPVPNRHAALHGLVTYRSRKTSLNALIMADFIFHIVSRMKRQIVQEEGTANLRNM
ncbi:MAG: hypothetical protein ACRYG4_24945 [Janthinobacterium lividum]